MFFLYYAYTFSLYEADGYNLDQMNITIIRLLVHGRRRLGGANLEAN